MKRIPLTKGQFAIVDDADFGWLSNRKWYAAFDKCTQSFRAFAGVHERLGHRRYRRTTLQMHRVIVGAGPNEDVDHRNHNTLDNRRRNLRKCTGAQNNQNRRWDRVGKSSVFKGVTKRPNGKFRARICLGYRSRHLGIFPTAEDAALAYNLAARELFGKFAHLNKVRGR